MSITQTHTRRFQNWKRTQKTDTEQTWWRVGATHVAAEYERITIKKYELRNKTVWKAYLESLDAYGNSVTTRTLAEKRVSRWDDAEQVCVEMSKEHMDDFPGRKPFGGKPAIPDSIGEWDLTEDTVSMWRWEAGTRALTVMQTDRVSRYSGSTTYYTVCQSDAEEKITVHDRVLRQQALRTVERCMFAYPSGRIGDGERFDALLDIDGVGPVKGRKLQAHGILTSSPR